MAAAARKRVAWKWFYKCFVTTTIWQKLIMLCHVHLQGTCSFWEELVLETLPTVVRAVVIALSSKAGSLYHQQSWREPVSKDICWAGHQHFAWTFVHESLKRSASMMGSSNFWPRMSDVKRTHLATVPNWEQYQTSPMKRNPKGTFYWFAETLCFYNDPTNFYIPSGLWLQWCHPCLNDSEFKTF